MDTIWILLATFLVFFMQAGFAMVEVGFTRAKNTVNILMKNIMDFSFGVLVFFFLGYGLMFGTDIGGFIGKDGFLLSIIDPANTSNFSLWIFQAVFAATAATIVSGAMAERTKFRSYLVYTIFITALVYPVAGHWIWGGGWLSSLGIIDFAGSTVVHSVGGWAALAGALILGPRYGKYGPGGTSKAIPGHNISLAALGVFILWFGWFGFNCGSTLSGSSQALSTVAVTTTLAAASGAVSSMFFVWIRYKKPDASMTLNGALAGLVAITAGCAVVSPISAILIGLIAGIICPVFVDLFDKKFKIDDPVGAISVHGISGAFGTLAVGLFAEPQYSAIGGYGETAGLFFGGGINLFVTQLIGVISVFAWAFGAMVLIFLAIKKTIGLRVSRETELKGLDIEEHAMEAYSGFQIFNNE